MSNDSRTIETKIYESGIDQLPDYIEKDLLTTKEDLVNDVRKRIQKFLESISQSTQHTTYYYSQCKEQLDMFYTQINKTILPEKLEPYWRYTYEFTPSASILFLEHIKELEATDTEDLDDRMICGETVDQTFFLFAIEGDFLSVDEYAKKYEVEPVTVRQWIRRGKLKTAKKAGKEWYIPAMSDIPSRGYEGGQYRIREAFTDLPEEYSYLKDFKLVTIFKKLKQKNMYHLILSDMKGINSNIKELELTEKEREKIELFLMERKNVQFVGDNHSYCYRIAEKSTYEKK